MLVGIISLLMFPSWEEQMTLCWNLCKATFESPHACPQYMLALTGFGYHLWGFVLFLWFVFIILLVYVSAHVCTHASVPVWRSEDVLELVFYLLWLGFTYFRHAVYSRRMSCVLLAGFPMSSFHLSVGVLELQCVNRDCTFIPWPPRPK